MANNTQPQVMLLQNGAADHRSGNEVVPVEAKIEVHGNRASAPITEKQSASPRRPRPRKKKETLDAAPEAKVPETVAVAIREDESGSEAQGQAISIKNEDTPRESALPPARHEAQSAVDILVKHLKKDGRHIPANGGHWKEIFLAALARAPIPTVAAQVADVEYSLAQAERNSDAKFARRWEEAMEQGADQVEAAAYLSAVFGDERAVFHGGNVVGSAVDFSHAMRTLLLKHRRPSVFGEKLEVTGRVVLTLEEFRKRMEEVRGKRA